MAVKYWNLKRGKCVATVSSRDVSFILSSPLKYPNPNNTVNSKHCSAKDPKHVFFRSRLLFSCHTSMQHRHPHSISQHTHTLTWILSPTHRHTRTQQSPPAPTQLVFFPYYVQMDTHNYAGVVRCWRSSTAPMNPPTEVSIVTGPTNVPFPRGSLLSRWSAPLLT